jgi:hypothetical protein
MYVLIIDGEDNRRLAHPKSVPFYCGELKSSFMNCKVSREKAICANLEESAVYG